MNTLSTKLIAAGILAILTLISGMIVSRAGQPQNIWLVSIHKMIAVGTVVLIVMTVSQLYKTGDSQMFVTISIMVLSAVLFLALIATGAFLTREEMALPAFVLRIHQIAPLLALGLSALTIFLMYRSLA